MKQVINKEDKAVSPIIATILLIAITVVLAATLVTILGGFTHGVSNTVETAGVNSKIVSTGSTSGEIYINVTSSSSAISSSAITLTVSGATSAKTTLGGAGPTTFTGGSDYKVPITISSGSVSGVSFELIYKGNVIYNSAS
jgi:flagellin-like protein